jgi:chitinase
MKRIKETRTRQIDVHRLFFAIMLACVLCLAGQTACFATTVVLQWDPNTDADLAGYKVYYQADSSTQPFQGTGASEGDSPINVGNNPTATLSGLDPAHPYFFAVTAYNTSGVESDYSNIVSIPVLLSPTFSITSPADKAIVSGTPVIVSTDASDNVGVTKVEFYVNGVLKARIRSAPYDFSWKTFALPAGTYKLMAKAYSAAGNKKSEIVTVTLSKETTPPTVSITSPNGSKTVSGKITVKANAHDNVRVKRVALYVDGSLHATHTAPPWSFRLNTALLSNGTHNLSAWAYDASGNIGQSSVSVNVFNDTTKSKVSIVSPIANATVDGTKTVTAPTVSINSPADDAIVSGTVTVSAGASDNVDVSKVEFYVNNVLKHTDSTASSSYSWVTTALPNGSYTLTVKAYDSAGNVGQFSVTATVVN